MKRSPHNIEMRIESHLDLPKGAKWFRYRVSIDRPLWFNWRPLEVEGQSQESYIM